jgi:hypothetical protein
VLVDHGWLRILGSGHARLTRSLDRWNEELQIAPADFVIVADDIVGGVFALGWEDTGLGYGAFVHWAFTGDVETFYENLRWSGWEAEVEQIDSDRALGLYPPPWSREGKDISKVSRRPVPAAELWRFNLDALSQLTRGRG